MTRKWTFMVYMAGDNGKFFEGEQLMADLQQYGWGDIREMASVGSTDEVAIVAQYDTLDEQQYTPRFFMDGATKSSVLVEKIPPVNTGDPKNLTDFIVWAETTYPAENYALVLWNHGTGWKEDDIYARYREAKETVRRDNLSRGQARKRVLKSALFLPTAAQIMTVQDDDVRGICYDDTSKDFLDNRKLVQAFADAEKQTGQRLAVLGMDACLMSMIEVTYQVREHADFMVGSQGIEPGNGWSYDGILRTLVAAPDMTPRDLSQHIVKAYGDYYMRYSRNAGGNNTQSAIDLQAIPQTFTLLQKTAGRIAAVYMEDFKTELAITRAQRKAQRFEDQDYVDLKHLLMWVRDEYSGSLEIDALATEVIEHLGIGQGPIVANFNGRGRPNANGLSIYFPTNRYSPFYDRQAFALSGWGHVIRRANQMKELSKIETLGKAFDGRTLITPDTRWIICPICEGLAEVPLNIREIGDTVAVRGVRDLLTQIIEAIQKALASPVTTANQWIDLPCPHCEHTFQYNVETGATRR